LGGAVKCLFGSAGVGIKIGSAGIHSSDEGEGGYWARVSIGTGSDPPRPTPESGDLTIAKPCHGVQIKKTRPGVWRVWANAPAGGQLVRAVQSFVHAGGKRNSRKKNKPFGLGGSEPPHLVRKNDPGCNWNAVLWNRCRKKDLPPQHGDRDNGIRRQDKARMP